MEVKSINTSTKEYLDFIKSDACIYNTPEWLNLYNSKCKTFGVYDNEGLQAVFNIFTFNKTILKFCIPPPYSPDCSLLIDNKKKEANVIEALKSWLEASKTNGFSQFKFCFPYKNYELTKYISPKGFTQKKNHTYVLDLSMSPEVQNLYAPKRRQQIRRAIKDGIEVKQITDMKIVFDLVKKTFSRQSKSFDEAMVKKILFEYAHKKNSFAFSSIINSKYAVVYFCIYHNNEAFYLLGGYDENIKHIGAGPLAMSACIEHAKKIGITTYDFEGSMEPSIEKYFKEFGGLKKNYSCFEKVSKIGGAAIKIKKMIKK